MTEVDNARGELWRMVQDHRSELVAFARKLVQMPSRSGEEGTWQSSSDDGTPGL